MKLFVAIPVFAAVCLVSAADAQKVTKPPKAPAAAHPLPSPPPPPPIRQEESTNGGGKGSPQYLERLLKLTPEQRNKALSSLPPARRTQILAKLEDYQKIPPQQRARELHQLRRLQTLPPQKQQQVRSSLKKFGTLPPHRQQLMTRQLNQMRGLSDPDRLALMNSEEFRNKFTPSEQQMIDDISLVDAKR